MYDSISWNNYTDRKANTKTEWERQGHEVIAFLTCEHNIVENTSRSFPVVLVKLWKVAHWNAKKLLKNCQKSKTLLPKFEKLPPKYLDILI